MLLVCLLLGAAVFAKESIVTVYQLTNYRGPGNVFPIDGCAKFERDEFMIDVASIKSGNNCVKLYETLECTGRYMLLAPSERVEIHQPSKKPLRCQGRANIAACSEGHFFAKSFSPCDY